MHPHSALTTTLPPQDGSCGTPLATPYLVSFMLLVSTILINLFPTVIIEQFESTMQRDQWSMHPAVLDDFIAKWARYDDGSGAIFPRQLEELLMELGPPLGIRAGSTIRDVMKASGVLTLPGATPREPCQWADRSPAARRRDVVDVRKSVAACIRHRSLPAPLSARSSSLLWTSP